MLADIITIILISIAGATNLFLTIYVYTRNSKSPINKSFLYFGGSLVLWCFVNLLLLIFKETFYIRLTYSVGTIFSLTSIFFVVALSGLKMRKWIATLLSTGCVVWSVVILFTPLVLTSLLHPIGFGWVTKDGPLMLVWEIYILLMILASVVIPLTVLKKSDDKRKKQIQYYITGEALFALWVIIVFLILPLFGINQFNNLDSPATLFLVGFTSYSIIKYNLLGIKSLFLQAFMYALVIIGIISVLLLLMFIGSSLLANKLIWPLYLIAVIVAIALFLIGRVFFIEKRDLEKAKINLTGLLEQSEKNRVEIETERDKTLTIINSFADGLIILDEKDKIFSINPEAEKMLGLKAEKILNKTTYSLSDFIIAVPIASVLNDGLNNIYKKEITLSKDVFYQLSVIPLKLTEKDIGHLVVLHDISREKIVDRTKSEFVSLAAHQLRTPLSIMNWSMSMLKKGDFGKLNKEQKEIIERAYETNESMVSVVNNLLNITRIEEGRYIYETSVTDIKELVNSVLDNYHHLIKNKKINVELNYSDDLPKINIDSEKIKIAIQNLIDNAIKYSSVGGKIIITLKNDKKNVEFVMQDFGIGIPKDQSDSIFNKFFRSDNAKKVDPNGTGIGLFLTENIISAHGGKIWFESEEGKGTSFHFSLPIQSDVDKISDFDIIK